MANNYRPIQSLGGRRVERSFNDSTPCVRARLASTRWLSCRSLSCCSRSAPSCGACRHSSLESVSVRPLHELAFPFHSSFVICLLNIHLLTVPPNYTAFSYFISTIRLSVELSFYITLSTSTLLT